MKIGFLTRICIMTVAICFNCKQLYSQNTFDRNWSKIEKLELEANEVKALEKVNRILKKAKRKKNSSQLLKAGIYKAKLNLVLNNEDNNRSFLILKNQEQELSEPYKALLNYHLALELNAFFNKNKRAIRKNNDEKPEDITSWRSTRFLEKIESHFIKALELPETFSQKETENLKKLFFKSNKSIIRDAIFDAIAADYRDFLNKNYRNSINFSKEDLQNIITSDELKFKDKSTTEGLSTTDKILFLYEKAIARYKADKNINAQVALEVDRASYLIKISHNYSEQNIQYLSSLKQLKEKYIDQKVQAYLMLKIAETEYDLATQTRSNFTFQQSLTTAEKALSVSPSPEIAQKLISLISTIKSIVFQASGTNRVYPETVFRSFIKHKNINQVNLKIYYLNPDQYQLYVANAKVNKDSIVKVLFAQQTPVLEKKYNLPQWDDFEVHSTEILVPSLKKTGKHILVFETQNNQKYLASYLLDVSRFSLLQQHVENELFVKLVDLKSGFPIAGQPIMAVDSTSQKQYNTDSYGSALIKLNDFKQYPDVVFKTQNDSLRLSNNYRRVDKLITADADDLEVNTMILLDRNIFRPGQEVFFKGYLFHRSLDEAFPIDGMEVVVEVYDEDEVLIFEKEYQSNEFGTFSDRFKLPQNAVTGEYYIEVNASENSLTYKGKNIDFDSSDEYFSVEEYKRQTFEVNLKPLEKTYLLNDTIKVSGNAKALFGGNISNAEVNYQVTRKLKYGTVKNQSSFINNYNEKLIAEGNTTTDVLGDFKFDFKATGIDNMPDSEKPVYNYTILVKVIDSNGETRTASVNYNFAQHRFRVNIHNKTIISDDLSEEVLFIASDLNNLKTTIAGEISLYKMGNEKTAILKSTNPLPEKSAIAKEDFYHYFPYEIRDQEDRQSGANEKQFVGKHNITIDDIMKLTINKIFELENANYQILFKAKDAFATAFLQRPILNIKRKPPDLKAMFFHMNIL